MATRRRPTRAMGRAVLAAAVLLGVLAVAAPGAGAADPITTTTTVTATQTGTNPTHDLRFVARVVAPTGQPAPAGTVELALAGAAPVRATLEPSSGSTSFAFFYLEVGTLTDAPATATYVGDATHAGSSGATTVTRTLAPGAATIASGTVTIGRAQLSPSPSSAFAGTRAQIYDPVTGAFDTGYYGTALPGSAEVPGIGAVPLSIQPSTRLYGTIAPDGSFTGTAEVAAVVRRIRDAGVDWSPACGYPPVSFPITGSVGPTGLSIEGAGAALGAPNRCVGAQAPLIAAALDGTTAVDLLLQGAFTPPPPPDTPTTTTLTVTGERDVLGRLTLAAAVAGPPGLALGSSVRFTVDGSEVGLRPLDATNAAKLTLASPLAAGDRDIVATYLGSTTFASSSDLETVAIAAKPTGAAASATIGLGALPPFSVGSGVLDAAAIDLDAGTIEDARIWLPLATFPLPTPFGPATITGRLIQRTPVDATIDEDNHLTFGPVTFRLESYSYLHPLLSGSLGECAHAPITATLEGTATATGAHLEVVDAALPALDAGSCANFATTVNQQLGSTVDLAFDIDADLRRTRVPTTVAAGSFLPAIVQSNQTVLVASVAAADATPIEGTITFADGDTVLGTVPVGPTGGASLTTALDAPGTRTITATYSGDVLHDPGSATTTVEVAPAPDGFELDGTVRVGTVPLAIGGDSVLVPQQGTSPSGGAPALRSTVAATGARLWFAPTTVALTSPTYGPLTAEVRLTQDGALAPAALGPDGRFQGLVGAFALQVRKVTLADGTTVVPNGCATVVLLSLGGQVRPADAELSSAGGGSRRYDQASCRGVGRAVLNRFVDQPVSLAAAVTY